MGNCCGGDDTKPRRYQIDPNKPDITAKDLEDVVFARMIKKATYDEPDAAEPCRDVTESCRDAFRAGNKEIKGGIHNAVGVENLGQTKVFKAWYFPENPDMSWEDFEEIEFDGVVDYCEYGEPGAMVDVTDKIKALQDEGKNVLKGGIHVALKKPLPMEPNVFCVWYVDGTTTAEKEATEKARKKAEKKAAKAAKK